MKRLFAAAVALCLLLTGCGFFGEIMYEAKGAEEYAPDEIVRKFHGDLDSDLSIFPDEIPASAQNVSYSASVVSGLFDSDVEIILDCVLSKEDLAAERERMSGLSKTIHDRGNSFTNYVKYDTQSYNFPAYITCDGFGNTYEYALIIEQESRIVYIYLAYPNEKTYKHQEYLKKDKSVYEEEYTLSAWSMYNHSFEKGIWVEFDD